MGVTPASENDPSRDVGILIPAVKQKGNTNRASIGVINLFELDFSHKYNCENRERELNNE